MTNNFETSWYWTFVYWWFMAYGKYDLLVDLNFHFVNLRKYKLYSI